VTEHPGDLARTATVSTPRQRTRELAPLGGDAHTTDAALVDSDLDVAFARCLRLDVANGDASIVTVRGYRSQLAVWVTWCADHGVDARTATPDELKRYREDLVDLGRQPSTIAHKLNVLRRVYAAAVAAGLRADNPVTGLRAPRDRRAPEDFGFPIRGRADAAVSRRTPRRLTETPARSRHGKIHDRLVFLRPDVSPRRCSATWWLGAACSRMPTASQC
jgi:hypothetical protein